MKVRQIHWGATRAGNDGEEKFKQFMTIHFNYTVDNKEMFSFSL